jgi:Major Facilitator Superfamily
LRKSIKIYLYAFLGNVLDHYELALYGLLIPVFSSLFLQGDKQIIAYIKSYAIFPLFLFSRLFGAWFFGKLGDQKSISHALSSTLLGMGITAVFIGFLPILDSISFYFLFGLLMIQNFFASGEKTGGLLYALDNSFSDRKAIVCSMYEISTILGYILATACVFLLKESIYKYWRYLYFFSAGSSILAFLIRKNITVTDKKSSIKSNIQKANVSSLMIIFIVCFSYVLYYNTMTLMNSWIPLVTQISYLKVLKMNLYLYLIDMAFLPVAGFIGYKYGAKKIMQIAIYLNIFGSFFCFYLFKMDSYLIIFLARVALILPAVLFSALSSYFIYQKVNTKNRFQLIAISSVIGAHLGKSAPIITYWIYQNTKLIISPAIPILGLGVVALYYLKALDRQTALDTQLSLEIKH